MKKYLFFLLIIVSIVLFFIFRPNNKTKLEVSGFEQQEKELRDKYASKHPNQKGYTKAELEMIDKDVRELIKLKREKAKQEQASSSINGIE